MLFENLPPFAKLFLAYRILSYLERRQPFLELLRFVRENYNSNNNHNSSYSYKTNRKRKVKTPSRLVV